MFARAAARSSAASGGSSADVARVSGGEIGHDRRVLIPVAVIRLRVPSVRRTARSVRRAAQRRRAGPSPANRTALMPSAR